MAQGATQLAVALNADAGEEYGNWTIDGTEILSLVALYHSAARNDDHAQAVIDAIASLDRPLSLLCQTCWPSTPNGRASP
jgi:lactam utilization protein B